MNSMLIFQRILRFLGPRLQAYLIIQLSITLCAWPFLAAWGLPLAPAGILGNLLFTPFLTGFLFLSSLIFFCELCSLPSYPFILLLETLTQWWITLLSLSNRSWLYTFAHPPLLVTLLLPLIALLVMLYKPLSSGARISILLSTSLIAGYAIPSFVSYRDAEYRIPFFTQDLIILRSRSETVLIDQGSLGRRPSAPTKVSYTLLPFLIKRGITRLSAVIIPRPSATVFKALARLIESFPIGTIYLPAWHGALSNSGWRAWEQLLSESQKRKTRLVALQDTCSLSWGQYRVTLTPSSKATKKNKLTYHELRIEHSLLHTSSQ